MSDPHDTNDAPQPGARARYEGADPAPNDDTVSLLDLIAIIAKRWKLIFFTTFFAALGIVLFSLYTIRVPADSPNNPMPNFYSSEARILLTTPDSGGVSGSIEGTDLGVLRGLSSLGGQRNDDAALVQELLTGRDLLDRVIEEFDLLEDYAGAEFPRTAARQAIRGGLTFEFAADSQILTVSFQSIDPVFATDVLQRIVSILESQYIYLTRDEARARTQAIETQLQQLEDDLQQARAALSDFQSRFGVVDPQSQGRETVDLIAQFRQQKFELELEREQVFELVQDRDDPQIRRINQNIARIEELIRELETGYRLYSPVSIPLDQIGPLTTQYNDLQRDLALKEEIYNTFQSELVRSRIEAQDTSRRFQVIEPPEVPELKAGPSRGTISMVVTITAFFLAVFTAFIMEYFERAGYDPSESKKLEYIKDQFRIRRRS